MAITGHTTREMFQRYDSVSSDDLNEAAKLLEESMEVQRICSAKKEPLDVSGVSG